MPRLISRFFQSSNYSASFFRISTVSGIYVELVPLWQTIISSNSLTALINWPHGRTMKWGKLCLKRSLFSGVLGLVVTLIMKRQMWQLIKPYGRLLCPLLSHMHDVPCWMERRIETNVSSLLRSSTMFLESPGSRKCTSVRLIWRLLIDCLPNYSCSFPHQSWGGSFAGLWPLWSWRNKWLYHLSMRQVFEAQDRFQLD